MKKLLVIIIYCLFIAGCVSHPRAVDAVNTNRTSFSDSNIDENDGQAKLRKEAEEWTKKSIEERKKKTPVKKGDLFYCKVAINPIESLVDSGLRAGVKDNVTNFGVIFSNGSQIISPTLKVTDPASGLRTAISESRTETFTAEYDGAGYVVTTYNKYIFTRILGGKYIRNYEYLDDAVRFQMYDCKKA